ncbi:hypothetical protein [Hymenobacter glacialis]|uniref:Uncharacterized protein n=1 Tax=Hymenobacter glacialis TaxID=1908236 RepID=A0A1G1SZ00_9BACT|nr:hypothetical protein [Hymenobacter glacialis]OGX83843.1 hypothetical protein BEN48_03515 [Hymenobacter glacialis]
MADFAAAAEAEIAAVQARTGLRLSAATTRPDVLHCSAIQWVRSTALSHACSFTRPDKLPVSHLHHSLGNGHRVGLVFSVF